MNTRHDNADGPEDIDKAFAEIVAELERDAPLSSWPCDDADSANAESGHPATTESPTPETAASQQHAAPQPDDAKGPRDWEPSDEGDDEDHYEPPEPPPLPTLKAGTVGGIALILTGLALLVVPAFASWLGTFSLSAGLIAISGGIGWLLFRMRQAPPESAGWDDGAQL